jgi:hypothetical protein
MTAVGHEDQFQPPRVNGRSRSIQATFAGEVIALQRLGAVEDWAKVVEFFGDRPVGLCHRSPDPDRRRIGAGIANTPTRIGGCGCTTDSAHAVEADRARRSRRPCWPRRRDRPRRSREPRYRGRYELDTCTVTEKCVGLGVQDMAQDLAVVEWIRSGDVWPLWLRRPDLHLGRVGCRGAGRGSVGFAKSG